LLLLDHLEENLFKGGLRDRIIPDGKGFFVGLKDGKDSGKRNIEER